MAGMFSKLSKLLFGEGDRMEEVSNLTGGQQDLFNQLMQALQGGGAGGAFGGAADYYRDLLDPSGEAMEKFAAPEMRRFQEEIMPQLAERFAGMGSGGALNSSMFRNAATREAGSLSERLAAMRAGLQQQGAAGMAGLGQQALRPTMTPTRVKGTPGLIGGALESASTGLGEGLSAGISGYMQNLLSPKKGKI